MCGIYCCYNRGSDLASYRPRAIACSKKQRHRGPDWSGCFMAKDSILVHERLAIVGVGECIQRDDLWAMGTCWLIVLRHRCPAPHHRG
jgi:asparagine synthetase B (glutamine-hydrolysing)